MSDTGTWRHALKPDWREAYVDPKIRALVAALNRKALKITTIASCQGHLRGVHPPYIYFRCPVRIATLIEKRLVLAGVRNEGLHHSWRLEGSFNKEFRLCWRLHSSHLDQVAMHGNIARELYVNWFRRHRIDSDLALLTEVINDTLDETQVGECRGRHS